MATDARSRDDLKTYRTLILRMQERSRQRSGVGPIDIRAASSAIWDVSKARERSRCETSECPLRIVDSTGQCNT